MLNTLDFLNVRETIYYNSLIMIFKIKNNFAPEYLKQKLYYTNYGGYYDWRSRENFRIDICKTNKRYRTLFYKGLSEYNGVPNEIKNVGRIQKFKEKLLDFVLSKRLS